MLKFQSKATGNCIATGRSLSDQMIETFKQAMK